MDEPILWASLTKPASDDEIDEQMRRRLVAMGGDPNTAAAAVAHAREMLERHRLVAKRGPLAWVFPETPLAEEVLAIVRLGAPAPLPRYAVLRAEGLDDRTLLRVTSAAGDYETTHLTDEGPVTLTLFADGRLESTSTMTGHRTGTHVPQFESSGLLRSKREAEWLLALAQTAEVMLVPEVGVARVVLLAGPP